MQRVMCVIETPKGWGAKYDFNPKLNAFELSKMLPAGLVFPYDFGFIPGTIGEDDDPLDVIIISEIPSFPGCVIKCRIIGAIRAEQRERNGERLRNDRYVAIPDVSVLHKDIHKVGQLPKQIMEELESFFINYNQQAGKSFTPFEWVQTAGALKSIKKAKDHAEPTKLIQLLLPLYDDEGKPFPERYYKAVKKKLADKFGGITIYTQSPASGVWKDSDDKITRDKMIVYEVMVSEIDTMFWKKYRKFLQKQFQQEVVLIRRSEIGLL